MKTYQPSRVFVVSLLACLLLSSVLIRAYYIQSTVIIKPIRSDALQYIYYGYNLAYHGTFSKEYPSDNPSPDSYRSPGYPLLVALSFILGGEKGYYDFLRYFQAVIGGFIPVLTYMAGILFLPFAWSMAAALLVGFNPHLVSMTSYCLTETLFGFTLLAALLFFLYSIKYRTRLFFIVSAILWGGAYLINETALFLPYLLAVTCLLIDKKLDVKKTKINILIFIILFSLFPCMWMIRNAIQLSPDAPKANGRAIATMSHGAYPDFIYKTNQYKYFPYREDPEQPEFGSTFTGFTKILWQRFKQRPFKYVIWYCFQKPYYLWSWNILQGQGDIYVYPVTQSLYSISNAAAVIKNIINLLHPVVLFFAFTGLFLTMFKIHKKDCQDWLLKEKSVVIFFVVFVYYTALYTIFAPWPRYAIPLRPVFYLCGLWTVQHLFLWATAIKRSPCGRIVVASNEN